MDEVDDLADLDLSTFDPMTSHHQSHHHNHHQPSGIDRHDDGWYDDNADDDIVENVDEFRSEWGLRANDTNNASGHPPNHHHPVSDSLTKAPATTGFHDSNSIIDEFPHPIMPKAGATSPTTTTTTTRDENTRTSLNPFSDHDNDDDALYKSGHTGDAMFIDSPSSPLSSHNNGISPSSNDRPPHLSPLNPFVSGASTNPFAASTNPFAVNWDETSPSDRGDTHSSQFDGTSNNNSNTEYVYLSRLPEENLGMVFGIEGDQENRRPINSVHVKSITPGGAAARACQGNNRILVGDEIKEIDGKPLNQLTHDECIDLFQEMPCNVVLTVSRQTNDGFDLDSQPVDSIPPNPKRFKTLESDEKQLQEKPFSVSPRQQQEEGENGDPGHGSNGVQYRGFKSVDGHQSGLGDVPKGFVAVDATIIKEDDQSLGLSIVPSYGSTCDLYQIKRLVPDGACSQSGCLEVGDRLAQCNGQNLKGLGQSQCLHVLKSAGRVVRLTLLRPGHKQQQTASVTSVPPSTSSFLPPVDVRTLPENTDSTVVFDGDKTAQHSSVDEIETFDSTDNRRHDQQQQQQNYNNHHNLGSGTSVPPLTFSENADTYSNPFILNSSDICNISGEFGDDSVFESPKQRSELEVDKPTVDEAGGYSSLAIPPPAQFSDSLDPLSEPGVGSVPGDECVTNIDDLLSLDIVSGHLQNYQNNSQEPATADLLSFGISDRQTQESQRSPFSIDNSPNPQSLEEFAELCFQNISDDYTPDPEELIEFDSLSHSQSTPRYPADDDIPLSSDLITLEEIYDANNSPEFDGRITQLPVSSEPDKFVSTISVVGKESEPSFPLAEATYESSQSPPFTTSINLTTSQADNVSVIDVIPTPQPSESPISSPTTTTSPPVVYSGSVVFHTYAGSSPHSISSASISLDGDTELPASTMNGTDKDEKVSPGFVHSTLGVMTNGDDDEVIQPTHAARNEQGKVIHVQHTENSNSNKLRNLNDHDVNELAGVLDGFGSYGTPSPAGPDDLLQHVCEDDIVPVKMTRDQKESAMDVLSAWKGSDKKEASNAFEEAVTCFSKSPGKPDSNDVDKEEETIKPMTVTKNSNGKSVILPSSDKTSEPTPPPQKNVSDLIDFLKAQGDPVHKGIERSDSNDSGVDGHVSEEDIVPIVMSKKEAVIANNVVSLWGNASSGGSLKLTNASRPDSMGVARSYRSGEEEDVILPMRHTKDPRGNSMWLPHDASTASSTQPTKQWDEGAVNDMANFFASSIPSTLKGESDSDGDVVEEEPISAQTLTRGEKVLASSVLSKWASPSSDKDRRVEPDKLPVANDKVVEKQPDTGADQTDSRTEAEASVPDRKRSDMEELTNSNANASSTSLPGSEDAKKVLNKVSVFENKQNSQDLVVLRPKAIRNPSDFRSKLAGFEKSSASGTPIETSRTRPKSMVDLPSSRKSWSVANPSTALRDSTDKRLSFKPLSSLRSLGSSSSLHRDDKSRATGSDRPSSSGLSASLFLSKTPRMEYPKTRQEDGSPFQVDVLAGIVGLGLKVKASPSSKFPQVSDVQRNGPLGRSNNVRAGDYLLSVNGTDLAGQTDSRVQQILRLLPRGLVKLVLTTTEQSPPASNASAPSDGTAKISCDNKPISRDLDCEDTPKSTITVKSLNGSETFLASSGEFEVTASKDIITEADFPDNVSSVSSISTENASLPPVTARIEISPGTSNGTPMKISIKPTPTPRPSSGLPSLSSTMSRSLNYASSPADSWDTSSADSTPRDSNLSKVKRISGQDLIASQRKPGGCDMEDKAISEKDEDVRSSVDSVSSARTNNTEPENQEKLKPVEEEIVHKSSKSSVHSAPKALSPKVPPPVAPKPRLSTSSISSLKSDDSRNSLDFPKSPPPVALKARTSSVNSDDTKEKEEPLVASAKAPKVSAGYERLQAIAKAKPTKPSRIIEKSRANVSSKAKMFESEAEDKPDLSKDKYVPKPLSSSLLPMSERRKSTGSFPTQPSSLSRPKSLLPKGDLSKQSSIPEHTSPTQESKDPLSAKSPTRMNSALSPRRTSLSEPSSSMAFTFTPKQAPKISQSPNTHKPPAAGKVISPQKEDVVFHKTASPSLSKALSPSLPPSKLESRSKDSPLSKQGLSRRSNSEASINMPSTLALKSQVSEEKMEDTMKMFDDLLQDAPVTHSATDPADILLWTPVRKDRPLPQPRTDNAAKKEPLQSADSSEEVKRPLAPPRKSLSSVNKKDEDAVKIPSEEREKPSEVRSSIEEDIFIPISKTKDSHLPPSFLKENVEVPEELPVQEEILVPQTKPKDSHLPPSFLKNDQGATSVTDEPCIEEDLIVPQSKNKDSHMPPACLLDNDNKKETPVAAPGIRGVKRVVDYDAQFRISRERDESQNVVANQLAADILKEDEHKFSPDYDLLLKNSTTKSKTDNIPAGDIANSIQKERCGKLVEETLTGKKSSTYENIPAEEIANDILHSKSDDKSEINENGVVHDSGVLLDIGGYEKNDLSTGEHVHASESAESEKYATQANEIIQTVIAQISNQPDLLFQQEKSLSPIEPASPSSSDDEPPPLPGAPPPPVIFRSNSEMLTDTAWLDNNVTKVNDSDNSEVSKPNPVIEEELMEAVSACENNHALIIVNDTRSDIPTHPDLSTLTESSVSCVDLNIVGQNIALDISKDLSGEDEELSHTKSDISEPLNSTGESSFQESDAIRLHSPASVDVLSEDSGMPGDEEFQEVNTDDAISPVSEFSKDNDVQETNSNVFTPKPSFYPNDSVKVSPQQTKIETVQHVNDSPVDVRVKSPSSPSPPQPPTLPSSTPPTVPTSPPLNVPTADHTFDDLTLSDPVPQSSDSRPSSKEISSLGDQLIKNTDSDIPAVVEETLTSEAIESVESKPVHSGNDSSNNKAVEQRESSPISSLPDGVTAENNVESLTVRSKRQWHLSSNTSVPSLVLRGAANETVPVDYQSDTLKSALSPADFVSLLAKTNEVLDSLSVSEDLELTVIHIHRDGDSKDLGIDLKSGSFYRVTKIKKDSPLAKEGSVRVDDWLIAVDNLWFPEVSLMRCLARLTKPKHNSLLVVARGQESPLPSPAPIVAPRKERRAFSTLPEKVEEKAETKVESQSVRESKPTPPPVSPRPDRGGKPEASPRLSATVPDTPSGEAATEQKSSTKSSGAAEAGGIINVMMMKGATGVGFCLEGGVGSPKGNVPIIIKRIFKGGPAEKCGQLKLKDEILSVNGVDFTTLRHYEAWNHLKFLDDGEVHFKIRRVD